MKNENIILDLTFDFSLKIISLYKMLIQNKEFVIARQLLRCATSIGANVEEANAGISKRDFISKMSISSKEAHEARYWLRLLDRSQLVKYDYNPYLNAIEPIIKILIKIVKTSQLSIKNKDGNN
jgi:four helix bundle protein